MREKLIELIGSTECGNGSVMCKKYQDGFIARIADHLLANGVIVLPCKPGEMVYDISEFAKGTEHPEIYAMIDEEIAYAGDGWFTYDSILIRHEDFGNTLFASQEEAELAAAQKGVRE